MEARKHMLDAYPHLCSMYDENDGNSEVFKLTEATATISSFTKAPEVITFYRRISLFPRVENF